MKINNNRTSFRANYINKTEIGKLVKGCYPLYEREPVSFVKINPFNSNDIKALEETAKQWFHINFTTYIYWTARSLKNKKNIYKNHNIYALTTQKSDFDNLNSEKILGLVHTSPDNDNYTHIDHIEVNPKYIKYKESEYKGIGTGILNSLKIIYNKLSCHPLSEDSVINFFNKNGFVKQANMLNYYRYNK